MTSTWHHLHSVSFSLNQPSLVENSEVALDDMVLDESDASLNSPLLPISSTTSNILTSNSASNSDLHKLGSTQIKFGNVSFNYERYVTRIANKLIQS